MPASVIIIGTGEMGELFARGLLKCGHPVCPVLRGTYMAVMAKEILVPEPVLVAVGENDLDSMLTSTPVVEPTVIAVSFHKEKDRPSVVLRLP